MSARETARPIIERVTKGLAALIRSENIDALPEHERLKVKDMVYSGIAVMASRRQQQVSEEASK